MRLYVKCRYCGSKIYINSPARIRAELPYQFVLRCPQLKCAVHGRDEVYRNSEVIAEPGVSGTIGGALVTGALGGLIAGPIGVLAGLLLGGTAGSTTDQTDREAAKRFNAS